MMTIDDGLTGENDHYDISAPGRHDYLKERTDIHDVHVLHAGQVYELPTMWFWEKQIHPFQSLPVILHRQEGSYGCCERTRQAILKALNAPRPYTGYVACGIESSDPRCNPTSAPLYVCIAYVSQKTVAERQVLTPSGLKPLPDAVVLKGRYRAQCTSVILPPRGSMRSRAATAVVRVEPDHSYAPMPREFRRGELFWGLREARMFDAPYVLERVLCLYQQVVPGVEVPRDKDVERVSFWLLESLPLPSGQQYSLFSLPALPRLKGIRTVLEEWQRKAVFTCSHCRATFGSVKNTIPMSDLGPSGTFVNAYGAMHSITCVASGGVTGVMCLGEPTSEYSWFPQYAWTTACCFCGAHVGWRFTRVSGDGPEQFWGILQSAVRVSPMHESDALGCG